MEHKDIWLVIGLTIVLAVAVSVSTVSLTGDYLFWGKVNKNQIAYNTPSINPGIDTATKSYPATQNIGLFKKVVYLGHFGKIYNTCNLTGSLTPGSNTTIVIDRYSNLTIQNIGRSTSYISITTNSSISGC